MGCLIWAWAPNAPEMGRGRARCLKWAWTRTVPHLGLRVPMAVSLCRLPIPRLDLHRTRLRRRCRG
eukprot:2266074-Prymnesium_polylepis.1